MNSVKTAVILAILLGTGYWVYNRINTGGPSTPPPGVDDAWSGAVDVELPSAGGMAPPFNPDSGTAAPMWGDPATTAQSAPPAASGSMAPPFDPAVFAADAPASAMPPGVPGAEAPPFDSASMPAVDSTGTPATIGADSLPPAFPPGGYPVAAPDPTRPAVDNLDGMAVASDSPAVVAATATQPAASSGQFDSVLKIAQQQLTSGSLAEGLETLSRFYGNPTLSAEQDQQLTEILDQVAGTVIYSRQHLLEPPRVVRAGETLDQIAAEYNVPAGLLAKVNGIRDPLALQPGTELKVVRGPFNAVVNLENHELTLMLQGRYAGRFRIGVGRDCPTLEGTYVVKDKTENPTYYGRDQVVDAEDPANPWGERWIGLGSPAGGAQDPTPIGIHGTDNPLNIGSTADRGTICLGNRDAEDVYDILSIGSRVVIRR